MSVSYVYKVKKGIHKVIYDKIYFNCSMFRKMHYEATQRYLKPIFRSLFQPAEPNAEKKATGYFSRNCLRVKNLLRKKMAPGTEDESDQLIVENSSPPEQQSAEVGDGGGPATVEAACQIKCANCDGIFSPDNFDEHVCEYDESKKRIEPGSILDGHPCFRQIEDNMEQWKQLTKKKSRGTGYVDGTKDRRKRRGVIEKEMHRCGHCERKFVHASGLEKHVAKMHPEKTAEMSKEKKKDQAEPFKVCLKCLKCGMIFGSLDKMMEHLEMVDWEQEMEREDGSYMENGKMRLRKAFRIVILTTVYQCEFCDKHFSDFPSLHQHESLHDPISGYECTLCEIRIPCMNDMLFHRLNECVFRDAWNDEFKNISKFFACNVCDELFESLGALYEHRYGSYHLFPRLSKVEENESCEQLKVGCEACGTSFDNADSIFSHYKDAHGQKKNSSFPIRGQPTEKPDSTTTSSPCTSARPYLCEVCGKTYTQSSHLWQHLRFHNGVRPFICEEAGCNRSFTIRPDLKDHTRKCHTGERPYHCTLCDKRFLTGSVYYQHRLIHRGERRYGCEECGKRFYRADALKNHQRIHSGEKPFACSHCPKQFRQRGDREKHIRVKHSGPALNQASTSHEGTPLTSRARPKKQQRRGGAGGPKRLIEQVEPPEEPSDMEQVIDGSQEVPDAYDYSYSGNHSYHQQHPPPDGSNGNSCSDAVMIKIDVPPPTPCEQRFPKEIWKTVVALIMLAFNFILATVSLAMVHDRVPNRDTYGPLPDVVLDNTQPLEWALDVSEVLIMVVVNSCVVLITFHKHRFIVMRRVFLLMALLYFMRSITMYVTVLPMSSTSYYCSPKSNATTPVEIMKRAFQLISGFGLSINGKHTYCGDYIYSGHTVTLVMGYQIIAEYSPKKFWIIHWLAWCASLTGVSMVLLAHGHYTVDVLIAYYVTTRLFWTYHTLANNSLLLKQNGHNYIGREWWFFIFRYFEKNVRGPVPLQYDCPFPIPWTKRAPKLPSRES